MKDKPQHRVAEVQSDTEKSNSLRFLCASASLWWILIFAVFVTLLLATGTQSFPYNTSMGTPRFFSPEPLRAALSAGLLVSLSENAARHAGRVLRLREGDDLVLFDGVGGEYAGRIASVERERVMVELVAWHDVECESPLRLTLVQALQSGEKMDMTVQKAVELGVSRIVPVASRRSVVRLEGERAARRVEHWRGVAIAACEQCGRNRVPEVADLQGLERWLGAAPEDGVLRLMFAPGGEQSLDQVLSGHRGSIELLIGAEGGLTPEELAKAEAVGYVPIRLGPRILRTETAGLAALAAIQCLCGDFIGR